MRNKLILVQSLDDCSLNVNIDGFAGNYKVSIVGSKEKDKNSAIASTQSQIDDIIEQLTELRDKAGNL